MYVLVPTRNPGPTRFVVNSAEYHFKKFGLRTIVIATSIDSSLKPLSTEFLTTVPFGSAKVLIDIACRNLPQVKQVVFRSHIRNLGFGGSSNLTQLIGITFDLEWWLKVDDDCQIAKIPMNFHISPGCVAAGRFVESVAHPKDLLFERYPELADLTRLDKTGTPLPVQSIKNGALIVSQDAAKLAPYPVLFSEHSGLSLRGEAYDWARRIMAAGGVIGIQDEFIVKHFRDKWFPREWITQMLLKADIVFQDAIADVGGNFRASERERMDNMKSIVRLSKRIDPRDYKPQLHYDQIEAEAIRLTDKKLSETDVAIAFWQGLAKDAPYLLHQWLLNTDGAAKANLNWLTNSGN